MSAVKPPLTRRLLAEAFGTAGLVAVVVGSGIAAQRLSPDDAGLQLLENSTATVLGLAVLILVFGPVSGAHFNPVVTLVDWALGRRSGTGMALPDVAAYVVAQVIGAVAGAVLANAMYDLDLVQTSQHHRAGGLDLPGRGGRDGRPGPADLRAGPDRPERGDRRSGGRLHRRGVLVHQFHVVRQPRGDGRADLLRHLRRDRAVVRARLRSRATGRGSGGRVARPGSVPRRRPVGR